MQTNKKRTQSPGAALLHAALTRQKNRLAVRFLICLFALIVGAVWFPAAGLAVSPDAAMTRAEGVEALYQAEGRPEAGQAVFPDVDPHSRYADAAAWASGAGISSGYSNGFFGPQDTLTRQQFLTMLYRLVQGKGFGYQGAWPFLPQAADYEQAAGYAREGICWTLMQGILETQSNAIRPRDPLTRAQAEQLISRLYAFLNDDAVYEREGVYLGVEGFGTITKEQKDEFRYRFFVNGTEERYGMNNGTQEEDGTFRYELQNRLHEGELYRFSVQYRKVISLEPVSPLIGVVSATGTEGAEKRTVITIDGVEVPLSEGTAVWKITSQAGGASVASAQAHIGDSVWAVKDGENVKAVYIAPLTKPYTPPVTGTPGLKTLKNFLAVSMAPVGTTLYHYGGGWNWQDNAASEDAASIGLPQSWVRFFQMQDAGYTYKDRDGEESLRDPAHSYYPFGAWNEYFYAGADCSGYVGWALYNTMYTQNGQSGFIGSGMVRKLADNGWGTLSRSEVNGKNPLHPGDIVSISGHIYIVIGPCDDGSVVVLHSTPSNSRTGQPGGGAQIGAIGTSQDCEAYRLAREYMSRYYPDWFARYDIPVKSPEVYFAFENENRGRFRWNFSGEDGGLTDPDGWRNWNAKAVLESLFSKA